MCIFESSDLWGAKIQYKWDINAKESRLWWGAKILKALFSCLVEGLGSDFAVLVAINAALEEANWMGKAQLTIESYSKSVLNWINLPARRPWRWLSFLVNIDLLSKKIGTFSLFTWWQLV
ncbi:hypothetical protein GQ457_01G028820 [Hibiscus cannabinus]